MLAHGLLTLWVRRRLPQVDAQLLKRLQDDTPQAELLDHLDGMWLLRLLGPRYALEAHRALVSATLGQHALAAASYRVALADAPPHRRG